MDVKDTLYHVNVHQNVPSASKFNNQVDKMAVWGQSASFPSHFEYLVDSNSRQVDN